MSRRFPLVLSDELFEQFLRCFPNQGERTTILRKVVRKLVQKAKVKLPSRDEDEIAEQTLKEVEGRYDL